LGASVAYGLVAYLLLYGFPYVPYWLLTLFGLYELPAPYGLLVEPGVYGFVLRLPRSSPAQRTGRIRNDKTTKETTVFFMVYLLVVLIVAHNKLVSLFLISTPA